ncbi:hypothetical protein [Oscillatoria salina]|uniref:hypothetical protein n=1 Tax=Oscillatoria salina TaxID=331517 RepID=UPI0013BAB969|nr:hypothetical protein [Oscillatoria salina]MBZ8178875.1 hypothetical protein [Oscillatoria salina IIICB1]NET86699.1 hypothetical protein [Kamptonema sp. SIO1D9]
MKKSLIHNVANQLQWQTYQQLELLPNSVENPQAKTAKFALGLDLVWRLLIIALTKELIYQDQQVEYLERCWAFDFEENNSTNSQTLQKLWTLIK